MNRNRSDERRHQTSGDTLLVVAFSGETCAVPTHAVQELIHVPSLSRPPGLVPTLAGFLNLAGVAVPVVQLDRLFDLPPLKVSLYTPLLVLRAPERLGLIVERVKGVANVSRDDLRPVPEESCFNDCAEAQVVIGGRVVYLLSLERLFLKKERLCVEELTRMEQERLDRLEVRAS